MAEVTGGLSLEEIRSALIANTAPLGDANTPQAGAPVKAQAMDHQHPRPTSVTHGALNASGLSGNMNFTRNFTSKPGVNITATIPGGTQPVVFQVESWIMSGSDYTGCTIKGYRLQDSTLAAVTVLGISVAVGGASISPSSAAGANGVNFSLIAVAAT